jgi:hypothetical protein
VQNDRLVFEMNNYMIHLDKEELHIVVQVFLHLRKTSKNEVHINTNSPPQKGSEKMRMRTRQIQNAKQMAVYRFVVLY